jgi:hypothetical protein
MNRFVRIIDENDDVADEMHCLEESIAERVLSNMLNNGADVYMQDIEPGYGCMLVNSLKVSFDNPKNTEIMASMHLPFTMNSAGSLITSDTKDLNESMAYLISVVKESANGGTVLLTCNTERHPYVHSSHILIVRATAEDFTLNVGDIVEYHKNNDYLPAPM